MTQHVYDKVEITTPKFRTAYANKIGVATDMDGDLGQTIQEQKEGADINNILSHYQRTGLIEFAQTQEAVFGEYKNFDFHKMQNDVKNVENMFMELPSSFRREFEDNPQNFLDWIADGNNLADIQDGVIGNTPEPDPVEVAETPATEPKITE